jgi:hypothetical protein
MVTLLNYVKPMVSMPIASIALRHHHYFVVVVSAGGEPRDP